MIAIIDYGICNVKSVSNALETLGAEVLVTNKPSDLIKAEKLVLPGVGSFGEGMKRLHELGLDTTIKEEISKGKPFLGICLGMHMLATKGFETGETEGLGCIPGEVVRLDGEQHRIPHMGWDDVHIRKENPLLNNCKKNKDFYFVHSYHFVPADDNTLIATCEYGNEIAAAIQDENVFATQFHPEKSQENGLKVLENFIRWQPTRGGKC